MPEEVRLFLAFGRRCHRHGEEAPPFGVLAGQMKVPRTVALHEARAQSHDVLACQMAGVQARNAGCACEGLLVSIALHGMICRHAVADAAAGTRVSQPWDAVPPKRAGVVWAMRASRLHGWGPVAWQVHCPGPGAPLWA
jgi:hypothetical protein